MSEFSKTDTNSKTNTKSILKTNNSAARKIQKVIKKYTLKKRIERVAAATIIQNYFKRKLRSCASKGCNGVKSSDRFETCSTKYTPVPIENTDLSMYLQKDETEINLFNIVHYKPSSNNPISHTFFKEFYDILVQEYSIQDPHVFVITKNGSDLEIAITIAYQSIENKESILEKYRQHMRSWFVPYVLYILANSKIDIDEHPDGLTIDFSHPHNISELSGIHKDESMYTCLTYVKSPLSTEIAFDVASMNLEWLTCSPLFRFESDKKLFTLYFNDAYIEHTLPIWEEVGKDAHELNPLEEYASMREELVGDRTHLVFGEIQTSREGKDIYQLKDGTLVSLPKKEKLDSEHRRLPLTKVEQRYLKQDARKKIAKPEKREVLAVFIYNEDVYGYDVEERITVSSSLLENYKIKSKEEKIELTNDSVNVIIKGKELVGLKFKGGKTHKKL